MDVSFLAPETKPGIFTRANFTKENFTEMAPISQQTGTNSKVAFVTERKTVKVSFTHMMAKRYPADGEMTN